MTDKLSGPKCGCGGCLDRLATSFQNVSGDAHIHNQELPVDEIVNLRLEFTLPYDITSAAPGERYDGPTYLFLCDSNGGGGVEVQVSAVNTAEFECYYFELTINGSTFAHKIQAPGTGQLLRLWMDLRDDQVRIYFIPYDVPWNGGLAAPFYDPRSYATIRIHKQDAPAGNRHWGYRGLAGFISRIYRGATDVAAELAERTGGVPLRSNVDPQLYLNCSIAGVRAQNYHAGRATPLFDPPNPFVSQDIVYEASGMPSLIGTTEEGTTIENFNGTIMQPPADLPHEYESMFPWGDFTLRSAFQGSEYRYRTYIAPLPVLREYTDGGGYYGDEKFVPFTYIGIWLGRSLTSSNLNFQDVSIPVIPVLTYANDPNAFEPLEPGWMPFNLWMNFHPTNAFQEQPNGDYATRADTDLVFFDFNDDGFEPLRILDQCTRKLTFVAA